MATKPATCIRTAGLEDAERLALLAGELGYPSTAEQIRRRLQALLPREQHAVLCALLDNEIVGWVHVYVDAAVNSDSYAEIAALVVARASRGSGIGATLLAAAERWARRNGLAELRVHSNVKRTRAHAFYLRHEFENPKSQKVFSKRLLPADNAMDTADK